MFIEIESFTNRTLPSPMRVLTPPECKLLALMYWLESGLQPTQPFRQLPQGYCFELGGTIVVNMANVCDPTIHCWPQFVTMLLPVANAVLHWLRSASKVALAAIVDMSAPPATLVPWMPFPRQIGR